MLQALLVTFREGIESFLIVGIVVAYLKKTQRAGLIRGVKIGLLVSVVTCIGGASRRVYGLYAIAPGDHLGLTLGTD